MKWKIPASAAVFATAAALSVAAAPAAMAATTDCTGDLARTTITGDLSVPAGATCTLGAVTVEGSIIVGDDGWLDATDAVIGGDVIATDAYGIALDGTSVGGDVVAYSADLRAGFAYLTDLTVAGNVELGGVDVEITDVRIDGSLSTLAPNYIDLLRTSVGGDVSIEGADFGVSVQGAIVTGSVVVKGTSRHTLVGAEPDGSSATWGNAIGGDLTLSGNTGNTRLAVTEVGGSLNLADNAPAAIVGAGVTAAAVEGDYTGTDPGTPASGDQSVAVIVRGADAGELTWSLEGTSSLVDLGTAEQQGDHLQALGELVPVRVTDTRAGAPAWSVTAQLSDFTAGDETLSAKYLGWTPYLLENEGSATAGAAVASGFDQGTGLSVARTLARADAGHDLGSSVAGAELELKLPVSAEVGTYTATLTLTALS